MRGSSWMSFQRRWRLNSKGGVGPKMILAPPELYGVSVSQGRLPLRPPRDVRNYSPGQAINPFGVNGNGQGFQWPNSRYKPNLDVVSTGRLIRPTRCCRPTNGFHTSYWFAVVDLGPGGGADGFFGTATHGFRIQFYRDNHHRTRRLRAVLTLASREIEGGLLPRFHGSVQHWRYRGFLLVAAKLFRTLCLIFWPHT